MTDKMKSTIELQRKKMEKITNTNENLILQ